MISRRWFLPTIILILITSTSGSSQTIRIDPDNAMGGMVTQIFDSVKYIPLETTKESLFGKIDRMEAVDSFFVISDFLSTHSLLIFKKNGKFQGKIKNIPSNKFAVDRENKQIYIYSNGKFYIYNMDGKLLKSVVFNKNGDLKQYTCTGNGNIIYISTKMKGDTMVCLLNYCHLFSSESAYSQLLSIPIGSPKFYERASIIMFNLYSSFFNWSDKKLFFSLKYDYNIYEAISAGKAKVVHSFLFPLNHSLPEIFVEDGVFSKERLRLLSERGNTITEIPDFFLMKNKIVFSIVPSVIDNAYRKSFFLYSTVTNNLLSFKHISPDSRSFFLPVGEKVWSADNGYFYSSLPSYEMFHARDEISKKIIYSPTLQNYFATQSRKSNPVIVQLKPKNNL